LLCVAFHLAESPDETERVLSRLPSPSPLLEGPLRTGVLLAVRIKQF